MTHIKIVIEGKPVPWKAHGGFGNRAFNTRFKEKQMYQWLIRAQFNEEPKSTPIHLTIRYFFPVRKFTSKARKQDMLDDKLHHLVRPDLDNLNKFLCDCMKNIVFSDDSQVVELYARKRYGENPRTELEIF